MLPLKVKRRYAEARNPASRKRRLVEVFERPRSREQGDKTLSSRVFGGIVSPVWTTAPLPGRESVNIKNRMRVCKDIRLVERKLRSLVIPAETRRWINATNARLDGRTPLKAILQGDTFRVLELLAQVEEGIYV